MKRNVLIFGLMLGLLLLVNMFVMVNMLYNNPDLETNDLLGYAAMVVVFSLTFFGIRNYRNKALNGVISLGKALSTGALIALTGATLYVLVWLFYYYLFVPDFLDKYIQHVLNKTNPAELAAKTKELEDFRTMYKNPFFVVITTYMEVLPVGLMVALISAFILKRKPSQVGGE